MRKLLPDVEGRVFGHPAASIVMVLSSSWSGNSHTARGVWRKNRPTRSRRLRSARVAFPTARLQSLQANTKLDGSGATYAMPVRLQFLVVKWCTRHGAAWAHLWTRRLKSKLCHCQLCVSWVRFPRQSRVAVRHTAVQHSCLTGPGPDLAFCTNSELLVPLLWQPVKVVNTPSDDEIVPKHNHVQKSRDVCPHAQEQLLELGVWLEGDLCCFLFASKPSGSSAQRRRLRRLRSWWRHERQAVTAALASAQHHSAPRGVSTATQTEAPKIEHVIPALAVTHAAPAPVFEYVAPAPVIEYIAPAPAVTYDAPSQQLPPVYTMTTVTTDVNLDIIGLVNPQFSSFLLWRLLRHWSLVHFLSRKTLLHPCTTKSIRSRSLQPAPELCVRARGTRTCDRIHCTSTCSDL